MINTHTCVFQENTQKQAERRLKKLRREDNFPEIKAYICPFDGKFRVYRKVVFSLQKNK